MPTVFTKIMCSYFFIFSIVKCLTFSKCGTSNVTSSLLDTCPFCNKTNFLPIMMIMEMSDAKNKTKIRDIFGIMKGKIKRPVEEIMKEVDKELWGIEK